MKTVKIVSAVSSSIIFILIALAVSLEDPLKFKYRKTIDTMIETGIADSENEILSKYPTLSEAKASIEKADMLNTQICSMTSGDVPTLTKAQEIELKKMKKELLNSRKNAERLLKKMNSKEVLAATP